MASRAERIEAAINALTHAAREEGIAYRDGDCCRDLDAEKQTEGARADLLSALEAARPQAAPAADEPKSAADVLAWLRETADATTGEPTQDQAQAIWNLMRHPATSKVMLAVQAWERGESYAKVSAELEALKARAALPAPAGGVAEAGAPVAFDEDGERQQAADALECECFDGPTPSAREADLWIDGWLMRARYAPHPTPAPLGDVTAKALAAAHRQEADTRKTRAAVEKIVADLPCYLGHTADQAHLCHACKAKDALRSMPAPPTPAPLVVAPERAVVENAIPRTLLPLAQLLLRDANDAIDNNKSGMRAGGPRAIVEAYRLRNVAAAVVAHLEATRPVAPDAALLERVARDSAIAECIAVVESEPELPGDPPDDVLAEMKRAGPINNARASVRGTKIAIAKRLRAIAAAQKGAKS